MLGAENVQHGLMTDAVRPDASADVVSMLDVLEHIPPDQMRGFLSMLHGKLRGEGLLVIKVPSKDGLYFRVAHRVARISEDVAASVIKRLWQSEYEFPHRVYFDAPSLAELLTNTGFEILEEHYLEEVPNNTILQRIAIDDTIPTWQGLLLAPAFFSINVVEALRNKSDALLVLARRREPQPTP